jgi:hypothetical protein
MISQLVGAIDWRTATRCWWCSARALTARRLLLLAVALLLLLAVALLLLLPLLLLLRLEPPRCSAAAGTAAV